MKERLAAILADMKRNGRTSKKLVHAFVDAELFAKSDPHELLVVERTRNPGRSRLTQDVSGSLTGGYFIPAKGSITGYEEHLRQYIMFHDEVGRATIDARYLEHSIFVREHALTRFIERDGGSFNQVTSALWPGLLIIEAMQAVMPERDGKRPFIVPCDRGLFLGHTEWRNSAGPMVRRQTYANGEVSSDEKPLYDGKRSLLVLVSTFISTNESYYAQDLVASQARELTERHKSVLFALHMMDVLRFASRSDRDILSSHITSIAFFECIRQFTSFFRGDLWRNEVRMANN